MKFIRNITRFSLGIIAAYTGFVAGNLQEQGKIDPNDQVFDIGCKFIVKMTHMIYHMTHVSISYDMSHIL